MLHLLPAYIAQHMILQVIGYHMVLSFEHLSTHYHYIYIYMCIYKFTLFESILLSILWAYHVVLLQTIRDHLIGYYGMSHGIVISTFIEVPNCIIFLLHGIIVDIA